jgi:hypothetical protein
MLLDVDLNCASSDPLKPATAPAGFFSLGGSGCQCQLVVARGRAPWSLTRRAVPGRPGPGLTRSSSRAGRGTDSELEPAGPPGRPAGD